jgi:hypothetical protein
MGVFIEGCFYLDEEIFRTNFVCRNFNLGDRVIQPFKGNYYHGTVVKKNIDKKRPWKEPWLLIKTDDKVDEEKDALLNGYGLAGPIYGREPTLFEDEIIPEGDEIYRRIFERPMTKEEIREHNKPLPF